MPKPFGGGGAAAGTIRPMARPQVGAAADQSQANPTIRNRMNDFFPKQGSEARYDLIMQLVQAGMANAQASGSPLASFLAPIAGAVIGGRATRKRDDAKSKSQNDMMVSVLGGAANDPRVQGYIEILNNPDTPAYLKKIAQSRLDTVITPMTARTSPRRSGGDRLSSSGSPSAVDDLTSLMVPATPATPKRPALAAPAALDEDDPLGILGVPPA